MKTISIIIPCFNAEKYIKRCVDSILPNIERHDQVIVVDDASTDNTKTILNGYRRKNVQILEHGRNLGPSKSRNEAVGHATGDLILFLDVDTEITRTTLTVIRDFFETNNKVGAIQCELRLSDRNLDSIGHFMSIFGFPYESGVNENPEKYQNSTRIFGAKSAGMAVRKNVFQQTGGFDENYLIYGEDTDLSWRIQLAGYKLQYLPKSVIYHHQKSSMTVQTKQRVYYEGAKNNLNYIIKNASVFTVLYMAPLHILGWMIISVRLLLEGKNQASLAIYKGIIWNVWHLKQTLKKRAKYKRTSQVKLYGEIPISTLIRKGWRWFTHV